MKCVHGFKGNACLTKSIWVNGRDERQGGEQRGRWGGIGGDEEAINVVYSVVSPDDGWVAGGVGVGLANMPALGAGLVDGGVIRHESILNCGVASLFIVSKAACVAGG